MVKKNRNYGKYLLLAGLMLVLPLLNPGSFSACAQSNNSISGGVFGLNRMPITDIYVELLDENGSSIQRGRTNGGGRYVFHGMPAGRFKIRVLPYGTDYDEQEGEVNIQTFTRAGHDNTTSTSAASEQLDFYLRLRKGVDPAMVGVVFAQDIPPKAQKLYEKALEDLSDKKQQDAFAGLRGAIEIFPKYFLALDRLGKEYLLLETNDGYQASAILLDMAVKVNTRSFSTWHALAHSLYNLKRYDEASKAVEKALELNSSSPEALLLSGVLLRYDKKFDEAEKRMLKAKEQSRDRFAEVHWELALLYANDMKRYGDAARELKVYMKVEKNIDEAKIKKLISDLEAKAAQGT